MLFSGYDIGIDLGTASVLVFVKGKGIVLREPSVVALKEDTGKVIAIGEEAHEMIGRNPSNYKVIRPLRGGVIADYEVTLIMLKYLINKVCGRSMFFKPRVAVCIPAKVTGVEKRAVIEACTEAGAKSTFLVEEPMAAAIGAGLNVAEPIGNMVVDIGGGTTDVAVTSLGGMVICQSIKIGGDNCDDAIIRYIRKMYNLMIGERTAEYIKMNIGAAYIEDELFENRRLDIRGRDIVSGLPRTITVSSEDTTKALAEPVSMIVDCTKGALEITPPELAVDISENGIMMTGGGALLNGLDRLIRDVTGLPVYVADNPINCVALGTGNMLDMLDKLNANKQKYRKL